MAIAPGRCGEGGGDLLGLWGDKDKVHLALRVAGADRAMRRLAADARTATFPRSAAIHAPAIRLERAMRDLHGIAPDRRAGPAARGSTTAPGACARRSARDTTPRRDPRYEFLPAEGEGLHQIPVGPVHAGIIEPGHFRFTANGETVVRLEERLGYVHKGIDALLTGADIERAAKRRGAHLRRFSTVAYSFAFARAVEAALGVEPPPRAKMLRGIMAELERIANHLGDIGAICNDAVVLAASTPIAASSASACWRRRIAPSAIG